VGHEGRVGRTLLPARSYSPNGRSLASPKGGGPAIPSCRLSCEDGTARRRQQGGVNERKIIGIWGGCRAEAWARRRLFPVIGDSLLQKLHNPLFLSILTYIARMQCTCTRYSVVPLGARRRAAPDPGPGSGPGCLPHLKPTIVRPRRWF